MKKILVPVNFSPASDNALEFAALLTKALNAEMHLLHVFRELVPSMSGPEPWNNITESRSQIKNEAYIKWETGVLRDKFSIKVTGHLRRGPKAGSIIIYAHEIAADLIIMSLGSHSQKKLFGNTTLKVLRKGNIPVLVVPERAHAEENTKR